MEVRAGRQAGRSDIADHLPAADRLARRGGDAAHVRICRLEAAVVNDRDLPAVAATPACGDYAAVGGCGDRRPGAGAQIDALVKARRAEDGVKPIAESRADAAG